MEYLQQKQRMEQEAQQQQIKALVEQQRLLSEYQQQQQKMQMEYLMDLTKRRVKCKEMGLPNCDALQ